MFTTEDYIYGWLIYSAAGLVFFACWWWLTRRIRIVEIRAVLRVGALVTMFVPWYASPDLDFLAPAVVIAGIEGIFEGVFWRAGGPLLVALGVGIFLALVYSIVRRFRDRFQQDEAPAATEGAGATR